MTDKLEDAVGWPEHDLTRANLFLNHSRAKHANSCWRCDEAWPCLTMRAIIDADHEWAQWHDRWIAALDLMGSQAGRAARAEAELHKTHALMLTYKSALAAERTNREKDRLAIEAMTDQAQENWERAEKAEAELLVSVKGGRLILEDLERAKAKVREQAEEIERLQNKLNTDSQNFELECRKAEIERLKAQPACSRHQDRADKAEAALAELKAHHEKTKGDVIRALEHRDSIAAELAKALQELSDHCNTQWPHDECRKWVSLVVNEALRHAHSCQPGNYPDCCEPATPEPTPSEEE